MNAVKSRICLKLRMRLFGFGCVKILTLYKQLQFVVKNTFFVVLFGMWNR